MNKCIILLLLSSFSLIGCADVTTFSTEQIKAGGELIEQPIQSTTDSHVAREHDMHQTLRARDRQYAKAHEKSGTKVSFEVKKVNGIEMVFPIVEVRAEPRFEQPLPTQPSVHPFWKFGEKIAEKGLWAFVAHEFFGFSNNAVENAAPKYYGDYNPYQSGNSADFAGMTGDATFNPFTVKPEIVMPEVVIPPVYGAGEAK